MSHVTREATLDSRQDILRTAARLFQQRGYDATSMNDVAAALKLSKGGLYHHFQSKDEMLFHIMNHALDITEERVVKAVRGVQSPEERLRMLIRLHIEVVLSVRDREVTVQGQQSSYNGIARGVDEQGALIVEALGQLQTIHSGEVSLRLA